MALFNPHYLPKSPSQVRASVGSLGEKTVDTQHRQKSALANSHCPHQTEDSPGPITGVQYMLAEWTKTMFIPVTRAVFLMPWDT